MMRGYYSNYPQAMHYTANYPGIAQIFFILILLVLLVDLILLGIWLWKGIGKK